MRSGIIILIGVVILILIGLIIGLWVKKNHFQIIPNNSEDRTTNSPIDAVVTWVDSTTPQWIRSYEKSTGKNFKQSQKDHLYRWSPPKANPDDELSICLELIRKNMPWVRNTYVVTADSSQQPKCIKNEIIIHHDVLGIGPVFNSHAIESSLHRIPGLSENFIYLNDDVYVRKPVQPEHFFSDGIPLARVSTFRPVRDMDKWSDLLLYTAHVTGEINALKPDHTPHALTKSLMYEGEYNFPKYWKNTRNCKVRYDCEFEVSPIIMAYHFGLSRGTIKNAKNQPDPDRLKYIYATTISSCENKASAIKKSHIVCVNSLDGNKTALKRVLQID